MYLAIYVIFRRDNDLFTHTICCGDYFSFCRDKNAFEKELDLDKTIIDFSCHTCCLSRDRSHIVCLANSDFLTSSQDHLNFRRLEFLISLLRDEKIPISYKNSIKELL